MKDNRGFATILITLIVVIVLAIVGGILYYRIHQDKSKNVSTVTTPYVASVSDDGTDTGNVHITLSNGNVITPAKNLTSTAEGGQVGAESPVIASDKQTVGWVAMFGNCCTSYNIPLEVVIWRNGNVIQAIGEDQMVWNWNFVDNGSEVAILWGPTHGDYSDAELYDVITGKSLSDVGGPVDSSSPQWAQVVSR